MVGKREMGGRYRERRELEGKNRLRVIFCEGGGARGAAGRDGTEKKKQLAKKTLAVSVGLMGEEGWCDGD